MTDAEQQALFARLEKLERSNWRWKALASVLGVIFLLLLSLGLVSAVAVRTQQMTQLRIAVEEEQRASQAAEEAAAAQQRMRITGGGSAREPAPAAPKRMPREPAPGETP